VGSLDVSRVRDGLCRRALDRLPAGDSAWRARLLGLLAVAAADEAIDSSAEVLSADALAMARRTGDPHAELDTIAARHFVLSYPQAIAERTALARRTLELAPPGSMSRLWGLLWLSDIALQEGDMGRWDGLVQDIDALARRTGSPVARWHVARMQALRLALIGEVAAALVEADRGRRLAEQVGDISMLGMYFALRAQLAILLGAPDDILGQAMSLMDRAPAMPLITVSQAQIFLAQGRRDAAAAAIAPLRDLPERMPMGPRWSGSLGSLGLVATDLGDADLAGRCYRALAPTAHWCLGDGGGTPYSLGSIDWPLGEMARCAGLAETAIGHFRRAIEINTRLGARPFVAMARLGWARCLTDDDPDSPAGGDLAGTALAEFERLAMPGPAAAARRLLEHRSPAAHGDGLTDREAEVAGLVGQGLTNKQIAAQLFLADRTGPLGAPAGSVTAEAGQPTPGSER
jgi:tetratricopeptide (TPR) repeat protein